MRVKGAAGFDAGLQRYKGVHQVWKHPKYGWLVAKWPRKRGPAKTPAAALNQALFAQAVAWAKDPLGADVETAQIGTKATGYLIRDCIESAMYGLVVECSTTDGRLFLGRRMVSGTIQTMLDSIDDTPGAILYRGEDGWVGLNPGDTDQVLSVSPTTGLPVWSDGGGGNAAVYPIEITTTTISIGGNTVYLSANPIDIPIGGRRIQFQVEQIRAAARTQGFGLFQKTGGNGYFFYWGPSSELTLYYYSGGSGSGVISGGDHAPAALGAAYLKTMELMVIAANSNVWAILVPNLYGSAFTHDTHLNLTTGDWYFGVVDNTDITTFQSAVAYTEAY